MAELIDREAFLKRFTSEYRCKFTFGEAKILNVMFEELKKEATTTEAEIRAKAFSDLIEKIRGSLELPPLALDYIRIFAEQLKEEY